MYRVFLFLTFLAYCSSAPFFASNIQKTVNEEDHDLVDVIDGTGGGYSYFKRQKVDIRPLTKPVLDISAHDLAAYGHSSVLKDQPVQDHSAYPQASRSKEPRFQKQMFSPENNILLNNAYGQQQLIPRGTFQLQNLLPKMVPIQPTPFMQNDFPPLPQMVPNQYAGQQENFPQLPQMVPNKYNGQQGNFPVQSQAPQDLRGVGSQRQQQLLNSFGNQQPQQIWSSTQQKSSGFNSNYGGPGQSPFSSGFAIQSNQQNDQPPVTNARFMQSQPPPQRFNPSNQPLPNNGW